MLCLALGIKKMGFLTSSQSVQGWASSHFSSLVSRTSLQSLRLWCRLYGAVFGEKALCAHDVCWHWLNISMKPVWWWKVGRKEKQEERGNTSVAKTNGAVEFKNMIKLGWRELTPSHHILFSNSTLGRILYPKFEPDRLFYHISFH